MTFGERVRERRGELKMTRAALAAQLGVTVSAVSNYETGVSFPKEEILLRLFDSLRVDPNTLFQDSYQDGQLILTGAERQLLEDLRTLPPTSRVAVRAMVDALCACQEEAETFSLSPADFRQIPLYRTPAAAGYTSPAFGEDFDYIPVTDQVPPGAEFAVRIQGDSMRPYIEDGSIAYVNRDPLQNGDVGIFCEDGDIFCKQYYKDPSGAVFLFSLNRACSDADILLTPNSGRSLTCFGRVILHAPPLPGKETSRW